MSFSMVVVALWTTFLFEVSQDPETKSGLDGLHETPFTDRFGGSGPTWSAGDQDTRSGAIHVHSVCPD